MSEPASNSDNPYVGPRPFTQTDPLFGRDVEKVELLNLLIAERIVLLYSPSGAGKTSLLQAGLIPALETEQFRPLPIIRVNRTPADVISPNRYVASTIDALEKGRDDAARIPTSELGKLTLDGYLTRREAEAATADPEPAFVAAADPFVLIFDQFEEILTADPTDLAVKEEFFAQVGAALQPRHRWALFAMREEHVAALDPYLRHIPNRLATTFRLGLLGHPAAKEAIQRPAASKHVGFTDPAADTLIADLSAVKLPDGTLQAGALPFVEPLQLQVVCRQFWGSLPWADLPVRAGEPQIEVEHILRYARVDDALRDYYAEKVHEIAVNEGVEAWQDLERQIREWIEANLITERGTRAQLRVGAEREQWLPTEVIAGLANAYLIRSEGRPDDRWYELAHDRLVQPVRDDNAAWLSENLHKAQARARQWDNSGRRPETLPRGAELKETTSWVAANAPALSDWERRLMDDYVVAAEREKGRRRWRSAAILAALLAFVLIPAGLLFVRGEDEKQSLLAEATRVAVEAVALQNETLTSSVLANLSEDSLDDGAVDRALLLAVQAAEVRPTLDARRALLRALTAQPGLVAVLQPGQTTSLAQQVAAVPASMAISADGTRAAAVPCTPTPAGCSVSEIHLWDLESRRSLGTIPATEVGTSGLSLALSPDGRTVAVSSAGRGVLRWDVPSRQALGDAFGANGPGPFRVSSLAFSPDGDTLAAGGDRGDLALWPRDRIGGPPTLLMSQGNAAITSLAFNPDGLLAAGDTAGAVVIWDDTQPLWRCVAGDDAGSARCDPFRGEGTPTASAAGPIAAPPPARVTSVAFGGEGEWLAAGREDGSISVWDISGKHPALGIPTVSQSPAVVSLGFDPDLPILSAVTSERMLLRWNVESGRPINGATDLELSAAAFAGDGSTLITGDARGAILLWDLSLPSPLAQRIEADDGSPPLSVAIAADGQTLAVAGSFGAIQLLDLSDRAAPATLATVATEGAPSSVAFSADGRWLAAGGSDLPVWNVSDRAAPERVWSGGEEGDFLSVALSPDGEWLAAGDEAGNVLLWSLADLAADPLTLTGHERFVDAVAFSADSQRLASGGAEGSVRLWDLGDMVATPTALEGFQNAVRSVAFSPNEPKLAAAEDNGSILVWDIASERMPANLSPGQTPGAFAVAFGPDGMLAAATSDASIRLWDARTNLELGRLPLLSQPVRTLSFATDGTLASGGAVRSNEIPDVLLWSLSVGAMQQTACRVANRELTPEEEQGLMTELEYDYEPICDARLAGNGASVGAAAGTPVATPTS